MESVGRTQQACRAHWVRDSLIQKTRNIYQTTRRPGGDVTGEGRVRPPPPPPSGITESPRSRCSHHHKFVPKSHPLCSVSGVRTLLDEDTTCSIFIPSVTLLTWFIDGWKMYMYSSTYTLSKYKWKKHDYKRWGISYLRRLQANLSCSQYAMVYLELFELYVYVCVHYRDWVAYCNGCIREKK